MHLHYHQINIFDEQKILSIEKKQNLDDLLSIPIADRPNWSVDEINSEISNSAQILLGYVVRWIDQIKDDVRKYQILIMLV